MSDCDRCTIAAGGFHGGRYLVRTAVVRDGRAIATVPTASTRGMSFNVVHPDGYGVQNASPFVAVQYLGQRPGTRVGAASAANQRKASMCWAGTTRSSVSIGVRVSYFPGFDVMAGRRTMFLRAWASPTLQSTGDFSRTFKGAAAAQDIPCSGT